MKQHDKMKGDEDVKEVFLWTGCYGTFDEQFLVNFVQPKMEQAVKNHTSKNGKPIDEVHKSESFK